MQVDVCILYSSVVWIAYAVSFIYDDLQSQNAVTEYFNSKQSLHFAYVWRYVRDVSAMFCTSLQLVLYMAGTICRWNDSVISTGAACADNCIAD